MHHSLKSSHGPVAQVIRLARFAISLEIQCGYGLVRRRHSKQILRKIEAASDSRDNTFSQFGIFAVALNGEGLGSAVYIGMVNHPLASLAPFLPEFETGIVTLLNARTSSRNL